MPSAAASGAARETEAESPDALLILSDLTGLPQLRMQDLPALKAGIFRLPVSE